MKFNQIMCIVGPNIFKLEATYYRIKSVFLLS